MARSSNATLANVIVDIFKTVNIHYRLSYTTHICRKKKRTVCATYVYYDITVKFYVSRAKRRTICFYAENRKESKQIRIYVVTILSDLKNRYLTRYQFGCDLWRNVTSYYLQWHTRVTHSSRIRNIINVMISRSYLTFISAVSTPLQSQREL